MITSQELLNRHRNFGLAGQYRLIISEILADGRSHDISVARKYSVDRLYGIGQRFDAIVDFLCWTNILERSDNQICLSAIGQEALEKSAKTGLSTDKLLSRVAAACARDRLLDKLFPSVEADATEGSYEISCPLSAVPIHLLPLVNVLREFGVLEDVSGMSTRVQVSSMFRQWFLENIIAKINEAMVTGGLSQAQLEDILERQAEEGRRAEDFMVELERSRLRGHPFHSCILRISELNASAGYDIQSFRTLKSIVCDRFIEVKAVGAQRRFYWSSNEVQKAKSLGSSYHLALVDNKEAAREGYTPLIIDDPYPKFFSDHGGVKSYEGWSLSTESWCATYSS